MYYTKLLRVKAYEEPVEEEIVDVDEDVIEEEAEDVPVVDPQDVEVIPDDIGINDPVISGMFNQYVSQTPVHVDVTNEVNVVQVTPIPEQEPEVPVIEQSLDREKYEATIKKLEQDIEIAGSENQLLCYRIEELNKQIESLQEKVEISDTTILGDSEVDVIMDTLVEFQRKYFGQEGVPLEKEIPFNPRFIKNIPKAVYDGILCSITRDTPDVLNPALMVYFLMCNEPYQSIGLWWKIVLEKLVDGNREIIDEDARSRLADLGYEQEHPDGEEDDEMIEEDESYE